MIKCVTLNKEFPTHAEMFAALKANKVEILALKKATIKNSEGIFISPDRVLKNLAKNGATDKGEPIEYKGDSDYIYPVINTTNIMDSHKDVHLDGIWDKSIPEQKGKIYYAINHKLEIGSIIAYPKDVEIFAKTFTFKELGSELEGSTQALIYKVRKADYGNKDGLSAIENKLPVENSVRMQYVKVELCINDSGENYKEEKVSYDKYISNVANKEEAEKDGYFFAVKEAKIFKEGSLVLQGSNSVTPVLYASEPDKSTHESKTQDEETEDATKQAAKFLNEFYKNINI
jgi:hypothetical protein